MRRGVRCGFLAVALGGWLAGAACGPVGEGGWQGSQEGWGRSVSMRVGGLRCEYLKEPLGIDVVRPRLGWQLAPVRAEARGQRQTAYHVLVSSTPELLQQDQGDLWDSGQVASDESAHVVYAGKPLTSRTACHWKVRVWDESGRRSAWSEPARWSMGLLDPADWKARWIGTEPQPLPPATQPFFMAENQTPDPWFRKTIDLPAKPRRAVIHVASVGYHELYVNGSRIGDAVLMPGVSDLTQRAVYVTYDITEQLQSGRNVVGLWLGVSWSIFPPYKTDRKPTIPLVIAQGDVELPDGQLVQVATDTTWKTHPSPNRLTGAWNFMNFGGELYDAGREVADWGAASLDDASWAAARTYEPRLTLSAEMIEPNRRVVPVQPVRVEATPKGEHRVDMGVNFAGYVEIDVAGPPGKRIDFEFSERADQPMTHRIYSAYIIGPAGKGTFRNRFNYSVGRWITIRGLDTKPEPASVRGWMVRTDFARAGRFECSNRLMNELYRVACWTFENLSLGGYVVDCPQRERMGYGGDAHATIDMALDNYGLAAFYSKWSQDWRDVQGKESIWGTGEKALHSPNAVAQAGNLPYTAPTYWGGGGPGWSGICVTLPWSVYRQYGDTRILEQNWPTIQRWLAFLESQSVNSLLKRWGGEWDFLGDWLWPGAQGVNGDTPQTLFFNNCYWIYNLQTAAKIAAVLGEADAAAAYSRRAEQVRQAVHFQFFNPAENAYVDGMQAYLAIALLVGVPPADVRPAVWKRLEDEIRVRRKGHIWAGITGGAFLFKTLLENGRADLVYEMASKTDYPSWGDMLKRGATTFWESWDGDLSLLHSSYLYIGAFFIDTLGGIQPDAKVPGYKSFVLRPGALAGQGVDWVNASYESLYGRIACEWKREPGGLQVHVVVPPNTQARLYLPARSMDNVRESGRPLGETPGVEPVGREAGKLVLILQPGEYRFSAPQARPGGE